MPLTVPRSFRSVIVGALALATVGVLAAPAAAQEPPPVAVQQTSVQDPSPATADPQAAIPAQDPPSPTAEQTVPTTDPPPPTTEPTVPNTYTPPVTAVPSPGDSLTVTPATFWPGQTIQVEARTFRPGSTVRISLGPQSRIALAGGEAIADDSGVARLSLWIFDQGPPLTSTTYPLYAIGDTPDRGILTLVVWLDVVPPEPAAPPTTPDSGSTLPRTGGGSVGLAALGTALVAGGWLLATVAEKSRPRLRGHADSGRRR
jgi:hypothetical protein